MRHFIGLSSGSSINGIDAALIATEGAGMDLRLRPLCFTQHPFGRDLRELLLRVDSPEPPSLRQVSLLHRVLGEAFANAARQVAGQAKTPLQDVLCIGFPGHTLWHETEGRYPSTVALGMASVLAERTGVTTLGDFRSRDVVLGGQGFPLTPVVDYLLFHAPTEQRVLIHLGGVATVLSLPSERGLRQVTGFQAAPCTILLDGLMRLMTAGREPYDAGGKHAVQGRCIEELLGRWLAHPLLQKRPPRSFARQEFGADFLSQAAHLARNLNRNLHDLLCTATHFVARAIAQAVERFVPGRANRILLSGGGVRNGLLWRLLEDQLAPVPLEKIDAHGIPCEARKATAFAALAALTMDGIPVNLPGVTGASGPRLLGNFTPGSSANWARCLAWMAAQTAPWTNVAA